MTERFTKNELIAVSEGREVRFSHFEKLHDEEIPYGYIVDTTTKPVKKYDPRPLLSILVRGYWEKPA